MYLILMVYACLISCSLINKSKCHSLAYFNLRWTCVVILHKFKVRISNANAFTISRRHLNAHSNAQHSNTFAFVNNPECD